MINGEKNLTNITTFHWHLYFCTQKSRIHTFWWLFWHLLQTSDSIPIIIIVFSSMYSFVRLSQNKIYISDVDFDLLRKIKIENWETEKNSSIGIQSTTCIKIHNFSGRISKFKCSWRRSKRHVIKMCSIIIEHNQRLAVNWKTDLKKKKTPTKLSSCVCYL